MISDRWPIDSHRRFLVWVALVGSYFVMLPYWLPMVLLAQGAAGLLVRAAVCVAVIGPGGLLMGYGFPTGMRLVSNVNSRPMPWFWGVNGAAGVAASSLAVACSIAMGISWTLSIGAICYFCLIPPARMIGFTGRSTGPRCAETNQ